MHPNKSGFRRQVELLHRLGPYTLEAVLVALGCEYLLRTSIETKLHRYTSQLAPEMVHAAGAHQFPTRPLLLVPKP